MRILARRLMPTPNSGFSVRGVLLGLGAFPVSEGPLELENGVPDSRTGVTYPAALAVEDHCDARV